MSKLDYKDFERTSELGAKAVKTLCTKLSDKSKDDAFLDISDINKMIEEYLSQHPVTKNKPDPIKIASTTFAKMKLLEAKKKTLSMNAIVDLYCNHPTFTSNLIVHLRNKMNRNIKSKKWIKPGNYKIKQS